MGDDHKADWLADAAELRRFRRQRAIVYATPSATAAWRAQRAEHLDRCIEVTKMLLDHHLDAWLDEQRAIALPTDIPTVWSRPDREPA